MKNRRSSIFRKKSIDDINSKIKLLGINSKFDAIKFLNFRLVTSFIIFFMIIYFMDFGYIIGPIVTFLYYILLPYMVIDSRINIRINKLEKDAVYFFEVLLLSLDSGMNLVNAIDITSSSIDSELSSEFKEMMRSIKLSKSFDDSLMELKSRIPGDVINNIILSIKDCNDLGIDIKNNLDNQIDYLRNSIVGKKKSYIAKIPLKISILSVIFYIPLILLLILGPVLIRFLG